MLLAWPAGPCWPAASRGAAKQHSKISQLQALPGRRPYTPSSDIDQRGHVDFVIKVRMELSLRVIFHLG